MFSSGAWAEEMAKGGLPGSPRATSSADLPKRKARMPALRRSLRMESLSSVVWVGVRVSALAMTGWTFVSLVSLRMKSISIGLSPKLHY